MMKLSRKFFQYFKEYQWSNILAMIKNNRKDPENCEDDFQNKLVVITGATSGIGYVTARKYAAHGSNLLCINRNEKKSEALSREIETEFGVQCRYKLADLSSLNHIHRVSEELAGIRKPIDVLIHNAGTYLTQREVTSDGLEKVFVVQYLASFIMNYILLEKFKSQKKGRIVMVNSEGHRFAAWGLKLDDLNWEKRRYTGLRSYGSAKTAQLLSMIRFDEAFRDSGVTINAMHPGAVKTETGGENGPVYRWFKRNFLDRSLKSPEISAQALYYLGVSGQVEQESGKFFNLTSIEEPAPPARDREIADLLWKKSLKMGKLNG